MPVDRRQALDYADRLMAHPMRAIPLTLRRSKSGVTVLYKRKAVTHCAATRVGRLQAREVAKALGVELPPEGESVTATIPNGAFFRVIAISTLPLDIPEVQPLLERYQEEAAMARTQGDAIEL